MYGVNLEKRKLDNILYVQVEERSHTPR